MGSVMDYEACKECGGVVFLDYYYHTGEEYKFCQRCGTVDFLVLKRDENGKVIKDKRPVLERDFRKGYGSYSIFYKEGNGQTGSFNEPITKEIVDRFIEIYRREDVDPDKTFLASWNEGEQTLLVGKKIPDINRLSFKEWNESIMKGNREEALGEGEDIE